MSDQIPKCDFCKEPSAQLHAQIREIDPIRADDGFMYRQFVKTGKKFQLCASGHEAHAASIRLSRS